VLLQLQREFIAEIRSRELDGLTPGMRVYAHAYRTRLESALLEDFPILVRALGVNRFSGLVSKFLRQATSSHSSLAELGQAFVLFLKTENPVHHEVARYEWMKVLAALAYEPPEKAFGFSDLTELHVPVLSPTLSVFSSDRGRYSVIWKMRGKIRTRWILLREVELIRSMERGEPVHALADLGARHGYDPLKFQELFKRYVSDGIITDCLCVDRSSLTSGD
jgi:hypothetical protein